MITSVKKIQSLFFTIFIFHSQGLIADKDSAHPNAFTTNKKFSISRPVKIAAGLACGAVSVYGILYLYSNISEEPLLYNYLQKKFLKTTKISPEGREYFYQKHNLNGNLDVGGGVIFETDKTFIDGKEIEYSSYHSNQSIPGYTIVYFGGTKEDTSDIDPMLTKLAQDTGVTIITPNYPGYGTSQGKKSFTNSKEMAELFVNQACRKSKVILLGYSFGGAIATHIATKRTDINNLILISTFSSAKKVAIDSPKSKWYEKPIIYLGIGDNELNNVLAIRDMPCRLDGDRLAILSFHGQEDKTVPWSHQKPLQKAAISNGNIDFSKILTLDSDHGTIKRDASPYIIAAVKSIITKK